MYFFICLHFSESVLHENKGNKYLLGYLDIICG